MPKIKKRDRKVLTAFSQSMHDIVLWSEDYENYVDVKIPKKHRRTLIRLANRIMKDDVQRLMDWLEDQ